MTSDILSLARSPQDVQAIMQMVQQRKHGRQYVSDNMGQTGNLKALLEGEQNANPRLPMQVRKYVGRVS